MAPETSSRDRRPRSRRVHGHVLEPAPGERRSQPLRRAGQDRKRPVMHRDDVADDKELDRQGGLGWELVQIVAPVPMAPMLLVFKRPS